MLLEKLSGMWHSVLFYWIMSSNHVHYPSESHCRKSRFSVSTQQFALQLQLAVTTHQGMYLQCTTSLFINCTPPLFHWLLTHSLLQVECVPWVLSGPLEERVFSLSVAFQYQIWVVRWENAKMVWSGIIWHLTVMILCLHPHCNDINGNLYMGSSVFWRGLHLPYLVVVLLGTHSWMCAWSPP